MPPHAPSFSRRLPAAVLGCLLGLTSGCASSTHRTAKPHGTDSNSSSEEQSELWRGLERHELPLGQKLLVVKGSKGVIGCPYLDVAMFERTGEACAIIPAADTAGMPDGKVIAVTSRARELGIEIGMSGREALDRIR